MFFCVEKQNDQHTCRAIRFLPAIVQSLCRSGCRSSRSQIPFFFVADCPLETIVYGRSALTRASRRRATLAGLQWQRWLPNIVQLRKGRMGTPVIEPSTCRMRSGCDATTPCVHALKSSVATRSASSSCASRMLKPGARVVC